MGRSVLTAILANSMLKQRHRNNEKACRIFDLPHASWGKGSPSIDNSTIH